MGTAMKWPPFLSTFVLNKICELIASRVRTEKGFKEVHLNIVAKLVFELCAQEVTSTQIYNHLRKWRGRWIKVWKLKDHRRSSTQHAAPGNWPGLDQSTRRANRG